MRRDDLTNDVRIKLEAITVVRAPTWVFAIRHAGRIAESIFALAET